MPTSPPSITTLPAAPDPSNRSTFNSLAYPWSAALPTFGTEISAVAANVKANADEAQADAVATAADRVQTGLDVVAAAAAQAAAESASNATQWVSGTTYTLGDVVWSPANYISYRRIIAGAGATDPSADAVNWVALSGSAPSLVRSARTSNTELTTADKGTLVDVTSGTFTQTFVAVATLGNGWYCYIRNSGTGDVTLDPNASETIDGLTSFVMYPGEVRLVQCDGSVLRSIVLNTFSRTFTSSGTFTKPPGYQVFEGLAWSGGSSGQKTSSVSAASAGGGGGGCFPVRLPASSMGASESITIGAGGTAVTGTANGNVGGSTSIGSLLTVYGSASFAAGGAFGFTAAVTTTAAGVGFEGASASTSPKNTVYGGSNSANAGGVASGSSVFGGAAGGSRDVSGIDRAAGTSLFGGSGGASSSTGNGVDGSAPGGGGGATQTGTQSGAGARGEVRIWGVI